MGIEGLSKTSQLPGSIPDAKSRTRAHIAPSSFAVSKMASCGACEKFGEPHLRQDHIQIFSSPFSTPQKNPHN